MPIIASLLCAGFALLGRWLQLHPERIVPEGQFMGQNTFGARLFRAQVFLVGTFAVFGGTCGALYSLLQLAAFGSAVLDWVIRLAALVAGILAAIHVRKEVKARPVHESKSPYGWWP